MNLIGFDFLCDEDSFIPGADIPEEFTSTQLQNGSYDDLYITADLHQYSSAVPSSWDNNTIIHATFDDTLVAGNIPYRVEQISSIRVKRRVAGTTNWLTIYETPIAAAGDFGFTFIDRFAKCGEYEYAIVPVVNESEQNYTTQTVTSSFNGVFICDVEDSYQALGDVSVASVMHNKPNSVVTTLENKYPYVIYNGATNYESGTVSGIFVEIDWGNKKFKLDTIPAYSSEVMQFLMNGRPKIIKTWDGRIWMADVVDTPTASVMSHYLQVSVSFSFVEIGSVDSSTDMYNNAFIDVNIEES